MESIRELYHIGNGPSSSHSIGPRLAADLFRQRYPDVSRYRVTLYGSLAATGKGHMTDSAIYSAFQPKPTEIVWKPDEVLPLHPNGMMFEPIGEEGISQGSWKVYSIGGGTLKDEDGFIKYPQTYDLDSMSAIQLYCSQRGLSFWEFVEQAEGPSIWEYLEHVREVMCAAIDRGIHAEGVLPGGLGVSRKAWAFYRKYKISGDNFITEGRLPAYALAVAEESASGGKIVTAPTCGSSGVVPAVLHYIKENIDCREDTILRALATAGLIGNLIKTNASISGAEVGCQGEIGAACSMAAGAATQLLGGTIRQVEYAAEMGLEHHLGLTCDPVEGLVQIPCIERNVFAASRAISCANFALFSDGTHRVSFDAVVEVMHQTGHDLPSLYRETSTGGLAKSYLFPPASGS